MATTGTCEVRNRKSRCGMSDQGKTKQQLISELEELRRRVAGMGSVEAERNRSEERKAAAEALQRSHGEIQAIYDGMTDGLLIADVETKRFVRANPAICSMLG
jgi:PAS domain-containing protein